MKTCEINDFKVFEDDIKKENTPNIYQNLEFSKQDDFFQNPIMNFSSEVVHMEHLDSSVGSLMDSIRLIEDSFNNLQEVSHDNSHSAENIIQPQPQEQKEYKLENYTNNFKEIMMSIYPENYLRNENNHLKKLNQLKKKNEHDNDNFGSFEKFKNYQFKKP